MEKKVSVISATEMEERKGREKERKRKGEKGIIPATFSNTKRERGNRRNDDVRRTSVQWKKTAVKKRRN